MKWTDSWKKQIIKTDIRKNLNILICIKEIEFTVKKKESFSLDGVSRKFYKTFKEEIISILLNPLGK